VSLKRWCKETVVVGVSRCGIKRELLWESQVALRVAVGVRVFMRYLGSSCGSPRPFSCSPLPPSCPGHIRTHPPCNYIKVIRVIRDIRVIRVVWVTRVSRVIRVIRDIKVIRVIKDIIFIRVIRVIKDIRFIRVMAYSIRPFYVAHCRLRVLRGESVVTSANAMAVFM
jgi:hypothetical protein